MEEPKDIDDFDVGEALADVEDSLRSLTVKKTDIDQAEVLFRCGWEAALSEKVTPRPQRNEGLWKTVAMGLAGVSTALAVMLVSSYQKSDVESQVVKGTPTIVTNDTQNSPQVFWHEAPNRPSSSRRSDPEQWLRQTDRVQTETATSTVAGPATVGEWYREVRTEQANSQRSEL